MRKNYFAKIVNYTKKVFNIEKSINKLSDGRKNPRFKTNQVIDIEGLRGLLTQGIRRAKENKIFDRGTIDGLVVAAIDGTQVYNSDKKHCEQCLKAYKKGKAEQRNFHNIVVLSTIGDNAKLVIDFEPYRSGIDEANKDEGELTTAKRLTTCMNTNLKTLFKIIRARQEIENSIFHNLKTECGMEHCFVHGGNAIEAVLCILFLASNITQLFYYRRIKRSLKTQVELIRKLIKGLYLLKRNPEIIFNTG